MVRALRPVVTFRFGPLRSTKIGPLAINTEIYLCEREAGLHGRGAVDVFYHMVPVANRQLATMWERVVTVHGFAFALDRLNRRVPGGAAHVIPGRHDGDRDIRGLMARTAPHLAFTADEEARGAAALDALDVPAGAAFVCFHARDSAYLNAVFPGERDWSYNDYRNSPIDNYRMAVEALVARGYFALRMGAVVEKALDWSDRRILDYATRGRTDFLDIYLGAHCRFFLCSGSGLSTIPTIFRRPVAYVDYIPLEYAPTWGPQDLFIPKRLWSRKKRRFLTFREVLHSPLGRLARTADYDARDLETVSNTPAEIRALAVEMAERLAGWWTPEPGDDDLQRRFWSCFPRSELNQVFNARIGAAFLREHRSLLDAL